MRTAPSRRHDIAAEIIRRVTIVNGTGGYVVRLNGPPTLQKRLRLMAARLEHRPIAIMPHKCKSVDEWLRCYGDLKDIVTGRDKPRITGL